MAKYARLPAVLEHLSEQRHALIQPLIHAEMLAQAMIMIMEAGRAMPVLQPADGADGLQHQPAQNLLAALEHLSEQGHAMLLESAQEILRTGMAEHAL